MENELSLIEKEALIEQALSTNDGRMALAASINTLVAFCGNTDCKTRKIAGNSFEIKDNPQPNPLTKSNFYCRIKGRGSEITEYNSNVIFSPSHPLQDDDMIRTIQRCVELSRNDSIAPQGVVTNLGESDQLVASHRNVSCKMGKISGNSKKDNPKQSPLFIQRECSETKLYNSNIMHAPRIPQEDDEIVRAVHINESTEIGRNTNPLALVSSNIKKQNDAKLNLASKNFRICWKHPLSFEYLEGNNFKNRVNQQAKFVQFYK